MSGFGGDGRKVLVLGASSFVGRHLMARLDPARTIATYNRRPVPGAIQFDSVEMPLATIVPDPAAVGFAVLLLGDTQPDSCVADPARSRAVNVDSLRRIVDTLAGWHIPIVFTSSEFLFNGQKGHYSEADIPSPTLLYGRQKLEIERHLEAVTEDFATLRLAKVYGELPGDGTLLTTWLAALLRKETIRSARDQRFSPIFVGDVVDAILIVMEKSLRGLYHAAGPVGASRLELLTMLRTEVGRYRAIRATIAPCSIHDFNLPERRPEDVTMRSDKLVAVTGLSLRHPLDTCRRLAASLVQSA